MKRINWIPFIGVLFIGCGQSNNQENNNDKEQPNDTLSINENIQDYYDGTEGLIGNELKQALYNIIKGHKEYNYTGDTTDVWDILKETDRDPDNPENVILLYSGWSVNADDEYNSGDGWSREHVWSKSRGDFGTSKGAGTDVHHLRPADVTVNTAKNNRYFDIGGEDYVDGDGPTDCKKSENWTWNPEMK